MADRFLLGSRIFVAEDEYLIASDVRETLTRAGAEVLGPVPSVADAHELLARETQIDAAVLDVNLRGDMVFSVADTLCKRGVPVVFATGYDAEAFPDRFAHMPRMEKPLDAGDLTKVLEPLLRSLTREPR